MEENKSQTEEAKKEKQSRKSQPKKKSAAEQEQLLFGKYSFKDVEVKDPSVKAYVNTYSIYLPYTFGRRKYPSYYERRANIVERFMNKLMRGGTGKKVGGKVIRTEGRLQGKKATVMKNVIKAFEIIEKKTNSNPLQVLVRAIEHSAPIDDVTRVKYGGITYNVAVGISARRRVDSALKNLALAALISAFKKRKSLAEAIADELILASSNSSESFAVKRKVELERIARSAR
ncbi:MAG: 30S ribosomal protein S7 [Candidatus Micrarchaeaceae archaeon]